MYDYFVEYQMFLYLDLIFGVYCRLPVYIYLDLYPFGALFSLLSHATLSIIYALHSCFMIGVFCRQSAYILIYIPFLVFSLLNQIIFLKSHLYHYYVVLIPQLPSPAPSLASLRLESATIFFLSHLY